MSLRAIQTEVHELPIPNPEPYLSRKQLAKRLGVGLTTVDKLVKEGLPSETWGLRTRRFQMSKVSAWLRERERKAA